LKSLKIAVVIPTHNRRAELIKALSSVFNQTVPAAEIIVVDDGSQPPLANDIFDQAPALLKTRLLRNKIPAGAAAARNKGIANTECEWIAFLDDDDAFNSEKLETVIKELGEHPEVDLVYHPAKIHFVNERTTYFSRPGLLDNNKDNFRKLFIKNEIGGTSMVVARRGSLIQAGLFTEALPAIEDHELWLKMAKAGFNFLRINSPLTDYFYNTKKKSLTKNLELRDLALKYIETKFTEEYSRFDLKSKRLYEERKMREKVFISILNLQLFSAFVFQIKLFLLSLNLKELLFAFFIPFGPRTIFKIRSLIK